MSTEQRALFLRGQPEYQKSKQPQQGALNLSEVQLQNGHGDAVGDGFAQLRRDQPQAALALGQAELPLHFHTLTFVQEILRLVSDLVLLRPAQRRSGEPDAVLLAKPQVLPVAVDLICQNPTGIMPLPFLEPLCHCRQIPSLVVGVE